MIPTTKGLNLTNLISNPPVHNLSLDLRNAWIVEYILLRSLQRMFLSHISFFCFISLCQIALFWLMGLGLDYWAAIQQKSDMSRRKGVGFFA